MPALSRFALTTISAGLLLAGAAAGWLIRGQTEPSRPSVSRIPPAPPTTPSAPSGTDAPAPRATAAYGKPEWDALPLRQRLDKGFTIADHHRRFAHFASLLSTLTTQEEFETAARAIKDGDKRGLSFNQEWEHLLEQWGRKLGPAAIEFVQANFADPREPSWSLKRMLHGWAESDPLAASAWLNEHTDAPDWDGLLFETLAGISRNSLDTATQAALKSMPSGKSRAKDQVMNDLAETAVREGGLERLGSWFVALPETESGSELRTAAFPAVFQKMDHAGEEVARKFLEDCAPHSWRLTGAYRSMANKMAAKDPRAALEWLGSLSPPPGEPPPVVKWPGGNQVVSSWQQRDPAAFNAWLQSQPPGAFTDAVTAWAGGK